MAALVKRLRRRGWCDHVLDDGDRPGWTIRCIVCGQEWRRGPRHSTSQGASLHLPQYVDEPEDLGEGHAPGDPEPDPVDGSGPRQS
jgi:hypothetical protein